MILSKSCLYLSMESKLAENKYSDFMQNYSETGGQSSGAHLRRSFGFNSDSITPSDGVDERSGAPISKQGVYSTKSSFSLPPTVPTSFSERVGDLTSSVEHKKRIIEHYRNKSSSSSPMESGTDLVPSTLELPPFVFRRIPKLDHPIVNVAAMKDWDAQREKSGVVEGWLDNVFSNDKIYEDVILKLREQILQLEARNNMLESNLDTAEIEIEYWRDLYRQRSTQPSAVTVVPHNTGRRIAESAWKLAVAKFVGSGDQFLLLKVIFHWRLHVARERKDQSVDKVSSTN
jgi:hypothetical protein